jgi:hypothetical protein
MSEMSEKTEINYQDNTGDIEEFLQDSSPDSSLEIHHG